MNKLFEMFLDFDFDQYKDLSHDVSQGPNSSIQSSYRFRSIEISTGLFLFFIEMFVFELLS